MIEIVRKVRRVMSPEEAGELIGTQVDLDLPFSWDSPRDGSRYRIVDEDLGETIGFVTRLDPELTAGLTRVVRAIKFGQNVARQGRKMSVRGVTFGYAPPKVMARQEGCRETAFGRDDPEGEALIERLATELSRQFERMLPQQAAHDRRLLDSSVLADWRMGEESWRSLWTSGVVNDRNVLPYHRDGNNMDTWSAMPTLRYRMRGGYLHLPEYDFVFPCGDGDVTWFYGRGLVHGVTPMMTPRNLDRRPGEPYRYSLVFYALKGMTNCATYAEETAKVARKRTDRERAEVARIRSKAGLG